MSNQSENDTPKEYSIDQMKSLHTSMDASHNTYDTMIQKDALSYTSHPREPNYKINHDSGKGNTTQTPLATVAEANVDEDGNQILMTSAKPWRPKRKLSNSISSVQEIEAKLKLALNKLTLEKFDKLSKEIIQTDIPSVDSLKTFTTMLIDTAELESHFSSVYAQLARVLIDAAETKQWKLPSDEREHSFLYLLRMQLQSRFLSDRSSEKEAIEQLEEADREEAELKLRSRIFGHVQFIGELFRAGVIPDKVIHYCVMQLLEGWDSRGSRKINEEKIELLLRLLQSTGRSLDMVQDTLSQNFVQSYWHILQHLASLPSNTSSSKKETELDEHTHKSKRTGPLSVRTRFSVQRLIEMRNNGWARKAYEAKASTKEQVREQARLEQLSRKDSAAAAALEAAKAQDHLDDDDWVTVGQSSTSALKQQSKRNMKGSQRSDTRSKPKSDKKSKSKKTKQSQSSKSPKKQANQGDKTMIASKDEGSRYLSRDEMKVSGAAIFSEWKNLNKTDEAYHEAHMSFSEKVSKGTTHPDDMTKDIEAIQTSIKEGRVPTKRDISTYSRQCILLIEKMLEYVLNEAPAHEMNSYLTDLVELWSGLLKESSNQSSASETTEENTTVNLTKLHLISGVLSLMEFIDDIATDVPKVAEYFGVLFATAASHQVFHPTDIQGIIQVDRSILTPVKQSGNLGKVLLSACQTVTDLPEGDKITATWKENGLNLHDWVTEDHTELLNALAEQNIFPV